MNDRRQPSGNAGFLFFFVSLDLEDSLFVKTWILDKKRIRIIDGQNKGSLFHPLFLSFSFFFGILNEKENVM